MYQLVPEHLPADSHGFNTNDRESIKAHSFIYFIRVELMVHTELMISLRHFQIVAFHLENYNEFV